MKELKKILFKNFEIRVLEEFYWESDYGWESEIKIIKNPKGEEEILGRTELLYPGDKMIFNIFKSSKVPKDVRNAAAGLVSFIVNKFNIKNLEVQVL